MKIFIDESGTFAPVDARHSVSLVGALIFSDRGLAKFEREYVDLRQRLPKEKGEVKGKGLSETHIRKVIRLLERCGCLLEVVVMDSAFHSLDEIQNHKRLQAEKFTENITDRHHPNIQTAVDDLRRRLECLSPQLYLQSLAMTELVYSVLYHADIYYAFRIPSELGEYHWTMDAKGRGQLTDWEDWWSKIIMPVTQSKTMRAPFARVEGGDYSFQERFRTEPGADLRQFFGKIDSDDFFDLRPILSDKFSFSSDVLPGLEAIDIIANATRRALNGNLKNFGWSGILSLMVHRRDHYLKFMTLATTDKGRHSLPYADVVDAFKTGGRSIFPPEIYNNAARQR